MDVRETSFGENYEQTFVDKVGIWLSHRRIIKLVKKRGARNVADLGCGYEATTARQIRSLVDNVTVIDVALNPYFSSAGGFTSHVGVLPDVLEKVPQGSLDLVIMNSVLEHLDYPVETLLAIRGILRPGGTLFVNVPTWIGKRLLEFTAFKLKLSPPDEMEDHRRYYNKRDLWLELRKAGYTPSKIRIRRHKLATNVFAVVDIPE